MDNIFQITGKEKIQIAFIELCKKNSYADITIPAICRLAHLHRSTFYRYYENKDALLREIETKYMRELEKLSDFEFDSRIYSSDSDVYKKAIADIWAFCCKEREVFAFLLSPSLDGHFMYLFKNVSKKMYNSWLQANGFRFTNELEREYILEYLSSGLSSIVYKFLNQDSVPYSQVEDVIYTLGMKVPFSFTVK